MNLYLMNMPPEKEETTLFGDRPSFHTVCVSKHLRYRTCPHTAAKTDQTKTFLHPSEYKVFLYSHFPRDSILNSRN